MSVAVAQLNFSAPLEILLHIVFGNKDDDAQFETNDKTA